MVLPCDYNLPGFSGSYILASTTSAGAFLGLYLLHFHPNPFLSESSPAAIPRPLSISPRKIVDLSSGDEDEVEILEDLNLSGVSVSMGLLPFSGEDVPPLSRSSGVSTISRPPLSVPAPIISSKKAGKARQVEAAPLKPSVRPTSPLPPGQSYLKESSPFPTRPARRGRPPGSGSKGRGKKGKKGGLARSLSPARPASPPQVDVARPAISVATLQELVPRVSAATVRNISTEFLSMRYVSLSLILRFSGRTNSPCFF